jgi:hypothetical protein
MSDKATAHEQKIWVVLDKAGNWLCDVADEASAQMVADALNLHDAWSWLCDTKDDPT